MRDGTKAGLLEQRQSNVHQTRAHSQRCASSPRLRWHCKYMQTIGADYHGKNSSMLGPARRFRARFGICWIFVEGAEEKWRNGILMTEALLAHCKMQTNSKKPYLGALFLVIRFLVMILSTMRPRLRTSFCLRQSTSWRPFFLMCSHSSPVATITAEADQKPGA